MKLNDIMQTSFTYEDFINLEELMLDTITWNLSYTTTFDFLQHFLAQGCLFSTDQILNKESWIKPGNKASQFLKSYASFFSIMCQQNHSFLQYEPMLLACGIIMAARKMIRTKDKWPTALDFICGQPQISKVKRCMNHIFEFHEEAFPEHKLQPNADLASSQGS
jgi:hypothetical protein